MSNIKVCVVLDYNTGQVKIINYDTENTKDVEEMLIAKLGLKSSEMSWMCIDYLIINTEEGIFNDESPDFEN